MKPSPSTHTGATFLSGEILRARQFSLALALLAAGLSLAGLLLPAQVYPTETLRHSFIPNDVVNLFIGLPALLACIWLAGRERLAGLLCWPGALLYFFYNNMAYAVALGPGLVKLLQAGAAGLSLATLVLLLRQVDAARVAGVLAGRVAERWCGAVLAGFGVLFVLRSLGILFSGAARSTVETGVLAADLFTTPIWLAGGVLLWQRRPIGYVTGLGLLFQACTLFIGLEIFFLLQPLLNTGPFPAADALVILVMGLVVFVPFARYLAGVIRSGSAG